MILEVTIREQMSAMFCFVPFAFHFAKYFSEITILCRANGCYVFVFFKLVTKALSTETLEEVFKYAKANLLKVGAAFSCRPPQ
jgi:hypothetical protein